MPYGNNSCRLLAHSLYFILLTRFLTRHLFRWTFSVAVCILAVASLLLNPLVCQPPWLDWAVKGLPLCGGTPLTTQANRGILDKEDERLCCLYCGLRPHDVPEHSFSVIIHSLCQNHVEDPDQLTCHRYH